MQMFVHALVSGPPFLQWREVSGGDVVYLLPWILLIVLLSPKGGEFAALRVPWPRVPVAGVVVAAVALIVLVVLSLVAGA